MMFKWALLIFAVIMSLVLTIGAETMASCDAARNSCMATAETQQIKDECDNTSKNCVNKVYDEVKKRRPPQPPISQASGPSPCERSRQACLEGGLDEQHCGNVKKTCEITTYQFGSRG